MSNGNGDIAAFLAEWTRAELTGDTAVLDSDLVEDFTGIGPLGFLLPKQAWLNRFAHGLSYDEFAGGDSGAPLRRHSRGCRPAKPPEGQHGEQSAAGCRGPGDPRPPQPVGRVAPCRRALQLHRRHTRGAARTQPVSSEQSNVGDSRCGTDRGRLYHRSSPCTR
jgi:hypothetical protein